MVHIELLLTPLTWVTILCIESSLCTFDTPDMSNIALYWGTLYVLSTPLTWVTLLCIEDPVCTFDTFNIHSLLILYWYYSTVFHTFDTSDMPFDLLFIVQYMAPSTPLTSKSHLIYNVDYNTKSSNYMKIRFKCLIYFELQETLK